MYHYKQETDLLHFKVRKIECYVKKRKTIKKKKK